ncbi:uncharacterized protein EI90DRAFT_3010679 [Cantharellus anzutake]|uniref:uncharacterized protein n=1 Tax=Cantharellus anzutake TaxID=1750568 RepID=UPI001908CEA5|nr:uncharacterized protein EI90DRAFT_3010679 [Cantharellus anzutake]KAF8343796.1 hypothetical protein EI90DRAFT_3010679 [Cantharellus anzutake]
MLSTSPLSRRFQRSPLLTGLFCVFVLFFLFRSHSNPTRRLTNVACKRLKHLQSSYVTSGDRERDEREWEIRLGRTDYDAYVQDIQNSWRSLFRSGGGWLFSNDDANDPVPLRSVLKWLDIEGNPTSWSPEGQIPHRVYTTSDVPPSDYPSQFRYWAQNDPSGMFPPPSPMSTILSTVRKPVLKADILRYAILLHKGGIYTDIDTAATRPFKDWGTSRTIDLSDRVLGALPYYLTNSQFVHNTPPGMIVSLETSGTADSDSLDVLEWTGPGVFTDAVLRYMVARHGIYPRQISDLDVPARIGDLLILPARSFQADASEGDQKEQECVWHGFLGSWKHKKPKKEDKKVARL